MARLFRSLFVFLLLVYAWHVHGVRQQFFGEDLQGGESQPHLIPNINLSKPANTTSVAFHMCDRDAPGDHDTTVLTVTVRCLVHILGVRCTLQLQKYVDIDTDMIWMDRYGDMETKL